MVSFQATMSIITFPYFSLIISNNSKFFIIRTNF